MTDDTSTPSPYVFPPSEAFHGNDGSWSTFIMRIGSPAQDFRVLPSTNSDNVIIPLRDGCSKNYTGISETSCGSLRGAMPFNNRQSTGFMTNGSSTWKNIGLFTNLLGHQWGIEGEAEYGYDTVGLAVQNSGGPTLDKQVVAGVVMLEYLMGFFPLGHQPTNFSTFDSPQPSYLVALRDNNVIPGLGFGYTAGAQYQNTGVTGNLVLGGYDASRLDGNSSKTFAMGHDETFPFTVGLQNIVVTNTIQGTVSPLFDGIVASIDSTLPYLWLPAEVCDRFQEAFGLTYDEDSQLYLVNDTMHSRLKKLNPTISLTLGDGTTSGTGSSVAIDMPYAAFDLQASWPIMENETNYFPLKRATNSTQYTLGRTFLQEAYLSVDYERQTFNISQATFTSPMPEQQLVAVQPIPNATEAEPGAGESSSGLSVGAKVGIGVGVGVGALLVLFLGLGLFCFKRRCRAQSSSSAAEAEAAAAAPPPPSATPEKASPDANEAGSGDIFEAHGDAWPHEADAGTQRYELPSAAHKPLEMPQEGQVHELP